MYQINESYLNVNVYVRTCMHEHLSQSFKTKLSTSNSINQ